MVFLKTQNDGLYVSINSGGLSLTSSNGTCFFATHVSHTYYNMYTIHGSRLYLQADNTLTPDPSAAARVCIVYGPGNFFVVYFLKTYNYWYVDNGNLTFTDDPVLATVFVSENFTLQGVDIDNCMNELASKGYTVIPNVLPDADVNMLKEELELPEYNGSQIRRGDLLRRNPMFGQLLLHPLVRTILAGYLHPRSKCATWSSNTLYPVDTSIPETYDWHVDFPYHDMQAPWPTEPLSAQVLWCLDEFRVDNGGTHIIPGSHTKHTFPTPQNIQGKQQFTLCAPQGSIVIAHGAWWHSQGTNRSTKSRTCLLGTFVQPWIRAKDNMSDQVGSLAEDHPFKKELWDIV